jgi:hypothetical protein
LSDDKQEPVMRRISLVFAIAAALVPPPAKSNTPPAENIAPPVDGCEPMDIGPVYDASLDASSKLACFQLVTPSSARPTKLDINLAGFRANETHEISLVRVDADGTMHAVASDISTDAARIVQATGAQSTRWLILAGRLGSGAASPFQLQATITWGSDGYEPNDSIAKTAVLRGNQHIEANLDSDADVDHYLITLRAGQAQTSVEWDAAPGVVAELIDGANQQHSLQPGRPIRVDSSRPIFIGVHGTDKAKSGARYSLRTRDPEPIAVVSRVHSNEAISRLAPGLVSTAPGGANAARTLEVEATVFEGDGVTPVGPGQRVTFRASDAEGPRKWLLASIETVTDAKSVARATLNIGPCRGGIRGPLRVHTPSNRPEYWDISYNPESRVVASIPGGNTRSSRLWGSFQHVCKEVFRGYHP